jgi:protein O-mannosyl-transferase
LSRNPRRFEPIIICLILTAITLAAFWGVFGSKFVLVDDGGYVTKNSHVQHGLTRASVDWAFNVGYCGNWHPLTWMSHMLDCQIHGLNPTGHHATNLLLHIASTIILFLALHRMTRSQWKSAFVAALFAIHPLHVESVAWVAERKDVLSTLFWMLTLLAYAYYAERPSVKRYAWVLSAFVLGLMSKPMLVTLPFVLLLLDYWPLGRLQKRSVWEKSPLFVLSIGASIITFMAQRSGGAVNTLAIRPIPERVANALVSYATYMWKTIWPAKLAVFYPYPGGQVIWRVAAAVISLALVTTIVVRERARHPYLLVGWLWFVGALIPVIGLMQVGDQAMADRYTYVPLIGLFIMVAWGIPELIRKGGPERSAFNVQGSTSNPPCTQHPTPNTLLHVPACIIILAMAWLTRVQVGYWHDDFKLSEHALKVTDRNYVAHDMMGQVLADRGDYDEAITQNRAAIGISLRYTPAYLNLARALMAEHHLDEALRELRIASGISPNEPMVYMYMGVMLAQMRRFDEAIDQYNHALQLNPGMADCHYNLGDAFMATGRYGEAAREYRATVSLAPDTAGARADLQAAEDAVHQNAVITPVTESRTMPRSPKKAEACFEAGTELQQQGKLDEAADQLREAIRYQPDHARAHNSLGMVLQQQERVDEAMQEFRMAVQIQPDYATAHNNLAVALYFTEDYAEAWKEVHLCQRYGLSPNQGFVQALAEKMPDPQR